jgi:hypothetical protein
MKYTGTVRPDKGILRGMVCLFLAACFLVSGLPLAGQTPISSPAIDLPNESGSALNFRIQKVPVAGGAELLTIFADPPPGDGDKTGPAEEIPLISVLRDTLGDDKPENDRLRYVWMLSYTRPSLTQKISAFIPFLYTRTTNKGKVGTDPPPAILDVQPSDKTVWNAIFWMVIKRLVLGELGVGGKASASHYRQNYMDRRRSAIAGALAVLSLYQQVNGEKLLSDVEMRDIQARLSLSNKFFGWHMQSENLGRVYDKDQTKTRDVRGHNWELLRQYSEAQGLYFEPLEMPDGSATHAIVWTSTEDVIRNQGREFNSRFLNIRNPWRDSSLAGWQGYTQRRWFDDDDRPVAPETPNANPKTMIPLALYGLDHPKVPIILVDFRDGGNAKKREMSRRVLVDLTGNVVSLSGFGGLPFFFGRFIYEFATGRRGMDLNQATRVRSYTQLKLLLTLDASLDPDLRNILERRVESTAINPLENDTRTEERVAKAQYRNLIAYAKRPDGLPAKIERDRREEMVRLTHGGKQRALFMMAHVFSLGLYTHREDSTPELLAQMDTRRQLDHHERIVSEIAFASAKPEIDADPVVLRQSLQFIADNGAAARNKTTRSLAKIFAMTGEDEVRTLCIAGLYRINNLSAKKELLAIYNRPNISERWHELSANYLKLALEEGQRISPADAEKITAISAN